MIKQLTLCLLLCGAISLNAVHIENKSKIFVTILDFGHTILGDKISLKNTAGLGEFVLNFGEKEELEEVSWITISYGNKTQLIEKCTKDTRIDLVDSVEVDRYEKQS